MVYLRRILYKGILARSSRYSRHRPIDLAESSSSRRKGCLNCLEVTVRPFKDMRTRCLSSHVDVTTSSFFELSDACRSTASKLASLCNCSVAHELLLRDWKILLHECR
ncbi:hypothetical protein TNCV_2962111 [Trichonephila clavipes]|nr:hypothetical protein TNCV_2962111 [Trichonephila clavipes]